MVESDLVRAGIFAKVTDNPQVGAPLVLEGFVHDLTLTQYPHYYGFSYVIGQPLGLLGIPMGNWAVSQKITFRLLSRESRSIVWEKTYDTGTKGITAMYYGRNPMSHGYPYEALLEPVVADLLANLESSAL